jgi:hypothetical protein
MKFGLKNKHDSLSSADLEHCAREFSKSVSLKQVKVLSKVGLQALSPGIADIVFQDWWGVAESKVPKVQKKASIPMSSW